MAGDARGRGWEEWAAVYANATRRDRLGEPALTRELLPDEIQLQILWLEGLFGKKLVDDLGRTIEIVEPGQWNRNAGPDFLDALILADGQAIRGDIELDTCPEDWEEHRHGSNPDFNQVVLHVTCLRARGEWFTRNSEHRRVAWARIPEEALANAISLPPSGRYEAPCGECAPLFQTMSREQLKNVLLAAAAHRLSLKKKRWKLLCASVGEDQALYEDWAETLGYAVNKQAMKQLARRALLDEIRDEPEALLFGTAGFLTPVLPEACSAEARVYHKELWGAWWMQRERFELDGSRAVRWVLSGVRPANHPQRRLAALALLVKRMDAWKPLCRMANHRELERFLDGLGHPYWSYHATLPSRRSARPFSLIGRDRARDFIVNRVMAMDDSPDAWTIYLKLSGGAPSSRVTRAAERLLGRREDAKDWLGKAWMQQALLQIDDDFCRKSFCADCLLPKQAPGWM